MKFYTISKISENMHETPEGYLVCLAVPIARTGEMVYAQGETPLDPGPDGTVTIDRDEDHVFRPETLASFEGKAITILHPNDFVNPQNWSSLAKGTIQNVRRGTGDQSNDLIADLLITDSVAISLVKNGLREVSCGYEAEYAQTGEGRGVQTNIIGNHLALVDQGRAGSSYAINDHKRKGLRMKVREQLKAIFSKAQDEAMKVTGDDGETPPSISMDDVMKAVKDLGGEMKSMKDAISKSEPGKPAEFTAKDDDVAPGLEERLGKLEAIVAKLSEAMAAKASDADGDDKDKKDKDKASDEDCEDDDGDEPAMVGDTASRVEILAPGLEPSGKDIKKRALKIAYGTKDGKSIIHAFTGGKMPELKDEKEIERLFISTSEMLKVSRTRDLAATKQTKDFSSNAGVVTPERLNEINASFYAKK